MFKKIITILFMLTLLVEILLKKIPGNRSVHEGHPSGHTIQQMMSKSACDNSKLKLTIEARLAEC